MTGPRRTEPGRRDRIIDVTLDAVVVHGVAGATYRTIAEACDVPLGSLTYHFATRDDLLLAAFERFADTAARVLVDAMADTGTPVAELLTRLVTADDGPRHRILLAELYVLAYRDERYADLTRRWMLRAREAVAGRVQGVDPSVLDAVHEGLGLHQWFRPDAFPPATVRRTFDMLLAGTGGLE